VSALPVCPMMFGWFSSALMTVALCGSRAYGFCFYQQIRLRIQQVTDESLL